MRDDLLKAAIADANTVRETALANARLALEEAFKPHISSVVSARLRNEADDVNEALDSSDIGATTVTVKDPGPKEPSKDASDSSHIENKGQEWDADFDGPGILKKGKVDEAGIPSAGAPEMDLDSELGLDAGGAPEMGLGGEEELPSELDLEAIIRELELDVDDSGLGGGAPGLGADIGAPTAPEAVPGLEDEEPTFESFSEADAGVRVDGAFDGSVNETVSGDGDHGVHTDGKSPSAVDGVNGGKKVSPGQVVTGTKAETMTEEMDLDEILREVEMEEAAAMRESSKIASENVQLKSSLREHREVIQFLRGKLQEVNMLNAKLLYTNRLFKSFDLTGARKKAIVETFDRANSPREVKLIYTTLAEALTGKTGAGTKKNTARVVTESMASKPVGSTAPKSDAGKTILAEGNDLVARLQKLAGIKKNS